MCAKQTNNDNRGVRPAGHQLVQKQNFFFFFLGYIETKLFSPLLRKEASYMIPTQNSNLTVEKMMQTNIKDSTFSSDPFLQKSNVLMQVWLIGFGFIGNKPCFSGSTIWVLGFCSSPHIPTSFPDFNISPVLWAVCMHYVIHHCGSFYPLNYKIIK